MRRLIAFVRSWNRYDWLWLGWLSSFLAIEVSALRDAKSGGTFSEAWWWFAGVDDTRNRYSWITRALAFGFSCWLAVHLWTRRT